MKHVYPFVAASLALTATVAAQSPVGQSQAPAGWTNYGVDMADAGDVNGDGANDLFVGALVVIQPPPNFKAGLGLRVLSGLDLHVIWESTLAPSVTSGNYGLPSVDGGRDINGDGVPDLLIASDALPGQGPVDARSGVDGSVIHHNFAVQFGGDDMVAARFVGDVDGDGVCDYVAGMSTFSSFGKLVWFSGATGNVLQSVSATGSTLSYYGSSMDVIGDLDGDGVLELYLGDNGRAVIHDGRTGAIVQTLIATGLGGLGSAPIGDIDGDGRADFALNGILGTSSAVRAFSGATGAQLWEHTEPLAPPQFGASLSGVRDLDGDGIAELLVSGWSYPVGEGHAWILSGASGATLTRIDDIQQGNYFGRKVQGVDLDADGRSEVIVSAPLTSAGGRIESFSTCPLPPQLTCAGNQSQAGCVPTQAISGSTTWGSPVQLTLWGNHLPIIQPSLLLIGRNPGQIPFGANTLCLASPFRRILPQNTGALSMAQCSGYTQRVLDEALLSSLGFGPGDGLTMQLWIADPPAARGALSDALRIVLCP